jgi:hypothetical protein
MKKVLFSAAAVLALASCSNDSLVSDSPANNEAPIAFNVGQKNITRANLEDAEYYDFGVWAYKVIGSTSKNVMTNYLVGYNGTKGYPKTGVADGTWYYEGLNSQILRYWDHSTEKTNFYAYAPYDANASFNETSKTITVSATAGYKETNDVIFAGKSVAETDYDKNVLLSFKHIGAKVNIAFRESVPGYKVQLIDLTDGTEKGIQATPSVFDSSKTTPEDQYTKGDYNEEANVTINYTNPNAPTTSSTSKKTSEANLKFDLPTNTELSEADYTASPTTYYAVVQSDNNPGFTLHVSYKLIAEDKIKEEIIVRDARVFIPADMVKWESNKAYTYNFTITTSSTGNTDGTVVVDSPVVPTDKALNPIVFDNPTIVDYETATPYTDDI